MKLLEVILTGALGVTGLKVNRPTFPDVSVKHWASSEIERAHQLGIFTGRKDGKFYSAETMNRAQASAIIVRAFNLSGGTATSFSDIRSDYWTAKEIIALEHNGIIEKGGRYEPGRNITRAEFATYIARAMNPSLRLNQSSTPSTPPANNETVQFQGEVTASSSLNVRSGAGTNFSVLGSLRSGAKVDVYATEGSWYKVKFGNGFGFVSSSFIKKISSSSNSNQSNSVLNNRIIAIDPGHGGTAPGAVGNGLIEKDVVLEVSLELEKLLKNAGAKPVMTRTTDISVGLTERANIANNAKADIFVSIHVNAFTDPKANGTETLIAASSTRKNESRELAQKINDRLIAEFGTTDRGVRERRDITVLNATNMPAVLVELAFLSNTQDANLMKRSDFNQRAARAIHRGIEDYYSSK